jgi:hypothetical protein
MKPRRTSVQPPRVKRCLSWQLVAVGILLFFATNLVVLVSQLDLQDDTDKTTNRSPLQRPISYHVERKNLEERVIKLPSAAAVPDAAGYIARIQKIEKASGTISCRRKSSSERTYTFNAHYCGTTTTKQQQRKVTYYNFLARERIVCGVTIPANSNITLEDDPTCTGTAAIASSRLFPVIPDRTGKGMPSVQLRFAGHQKQPGQPFPCDVPCLTSGNPTIVTTRLVEPIDGDTAEWLLTFSMEGEGYYNQLKIDPAAYRQNHFYSTTSYQSEIPLPYFSWAEYNIQTPAVDFNAAIKGAAFLARNCASRNNREKIVETLQSSPNFRVDSLSTCLHNAEPPPGVHLSNKNDVMKHYLFYLAFENQCVDDYITEKLWGPLESGTIPVYYGSPNIKEYVPTDSIIVVDDFLPNIHDLADYLNKVAHNQTLYNKHQAWRSQPLQEHFHRKFDLTNVHSTCRTCRWAYSRFYGLGWNHANQSLCELETLREHVLQHGLLTRPVVEKWLSWPIATSATKRATTTAVEDSGVGGTERRLLSTTQLVTDLSAVEIESASLRRTLREHDGVIDLWIENAADIDRFTRCILRLETPFLRSPDDEIKVKAVSTGHVRLQRSKTRFTILTWPRLDDVTVKVNGAGGIVEIPVEITSMPLRIRILVEDIDTLHKGADEEENYFASLMIEDFFNPVEAFVFEH